VSAEFQGKVALVTGGSRGVGLSIAEALVAESASVFISGRNPATLKTALAPAPHGWGRNQRGWNRRGRSLLQGLPQFDTRDGYTIRPDRYAGE